MDYVNRKLKHSVCQFYLPCILAKNIDAPLIGTSFIKVDWTPHSHGFLQCFIVRAATSTTNAHPS